MEITPPPINVRPVYSLSVSIVSVPELVLVKVLVPIMCPAPPKV